MPFISKEDLVEYVDFLRERGMTGGIDEFLRCSAADGMSEKYAFNVLHKSKAAFAVRLPVQHVGKGSACHEIMENLRGKAWRNG